VPVPVGKQCQNQKSEHQTSKKQWTTIVEEEEEEEEEVRELEVHISQGQKHF